MSKQNNNNKESTAADLKNEYDRLATSMLKLNQRIEEKIKTLEEKETHWNKIQIELNNNLAKQKTKIKLDVGGKIFATSKSTLVSMEGTYFHALLGSGNWQPEEDGSYFIDRNPKHFDRILDYLRIGTLEWSGLDELGRKKLKQDLDYFQIPIPRDPVPTWDPSIKGSSVVLSNDNKTATSSLGNWQAVLGTTPVHSMTYHVDTKASESIMFGLAPKSGFQPNNTSIYSSCGFYLYSDGCLYSQSGYSGNRWGSAVQQGQTVKVVYDPNQQSVSFGVNGANPTLAYSNVTGELYPAICLYNRAVVSLVEDC
mmetsp:Transcript_30348/g.42610  ORF Transcript_30348/g.42610 Transcript_30348/m.42610 type:complete len:311 (+) Transcript_30348:16-948(+)